MSRENRKLLNSVGEAASDAGSEALSAISNLGGGDAGGTVGRVVSAVAGRHGGFAPKVITSVTKHGIAGIERVEPLPEVDRGYRAVAADANGLESIRTIIELDPREYDVTVTREEGAGVVEFVQEPEPEPTVEPTPPVRRDDGDRGRGDAGARAVEPATSERPSTAGEQSVEQARAEARKARAEAEAEKARAEAETARAEAEAAKARARAERARAEAETEALGSASTDAGVSSLDDPSRTPELDGGTRSASTPTGSDQPTGRSTDGGDVSPAFSSRSEVGGWAPNATTDPRGSAAEGMAEKWGVADDAGTVADSDPPVRTESLAAEPVDGDGNEVTDEDNRNEATDDGFDSFVAADPVDGTEEASAAADDGVGRWADDEPAETGGFEF